MIRTLKTTLTDGTELKREEIASAYVLRYLFDMLHGGGQSIFMFREYHRLWYGQQYLSELAEVDQKRLDEMVDHLVRLCQDVPDNEVKPAAYFPLNRYQRDIYFGWIGEKAGLAPLNEMEQKDLRGRLIAQHQVSHLTLLTDQMFLELVAWVRAETARRVAIGTEVKRALVDICARWFQLNPDQTLPVTTFGHLPDLSGFTDVRIEVGGSDRVPNALIIRIVSAEADEANPTNLGRRMGIVILG
jgi:hypothetical protein